MVLLQYQVLCAFVQQPRVFVRHASKFSENLFTEPVFKQLAAAMLAVYENWAVLDKHLLREYWVKQVQGAEATWLDTMETDATELPDLQDALHKLNEYAARRLLHELGVSLLQKSYDHNHTLQEVKQQIYTCLNQMEEVLPTGQMQTLKDILQHLQITASNKLGCTWFDRTLQQYLGELEPGELVVIGARPGMGKTAFLHTQLLHLAQQQNIAVGYINLVEKESGLAVKLFKASGMETGTPDLENEAYDGLPWPLYMRNQLNAYHVDDVKNAAHFLKYKYNIQVLAIDCFQQITYTSKLGYRDYELGMVLQELKQFAKELNVALLLTSQVSRNAEKRGYMSIPMLTDLKETSYLEELADKVLLLYRYAYYGITEYENGSSTGDDTLVKIAKNKTGSLGEVLLRFDGNKVWFVSKDQSPPFEFEFPKPRLADLE